MPSCFCPLREAFDEFEILANSYRQSSQFSSSLFFVMVDIDENGGDAFQAVSSVSSVLKVVGSPSEEKLRVLSLL